MLAERDRERRSPRDALGACRDGWGGTVLVSGEAGIGKTSLLTAFAEEAAGDGSVLFGAHDDLHVHLICRSWSRCVTSPRSRASWR